MLEYTLNIIFIKNKCKVQNCSLATSLVIRFFSGVFRGITSLIFIRFFFWGLFLSHLFGDFLRGRGFLFRIIGSLIFIRFFFFGFFHRFFGGRFGLGGRLGTSVRLKQVGADMLGHSESPKFLSSKNFGHFLVGDKELLVVVTLKFIFLQVSPQEFH